MCVAVIKTSLSLETYLLGLSAERQLRADSLSVLSDVLLGALEDLLLLFLGLLQIDRYKDGTGEENR